MGAGHGHIPGRCIGLVVALVVVVVVLALLSGRGAQQGNDSDSRSPEPVPEVAVDGARVQWEFLRGGPVAVPTTMAPPTSEPRVVERLLDQYRGEASRRIYRARPGGWQPKAVVLHGTGSGEPGSEFANLGALARFFARPAATASAHYAIDRSGRIMRFVADEHAAFHVATPGWNDVSIGIELLNDNSGRQPFPPAQLHAASDLVRWLGVRYSIPVEGVTRHRTIQPQDRRDPAGNFPWGPWLATLRAPDTATAG